jgi:hypothetical protein
MLAAVLLILNGRTAWVGRHRNSAVTVLVLVAALVFFLYAGGLEIYDQLFAPPR